MPELIGIGTKKTGYAKADQGPFECEHCVWFKRGERKGYGSCGNGDVIKDPEMKLSAGRAIVEDEGCCNRFRPGGGHALPSIAKGMARKE